MHKENLKSASFPAPHSLPATALRSQFKTFSRKIVAGWEKYCVIYIFRIDFRNYFVGRFIYRQQTHTQTIESVAIERKNETLHRFSR